MLAFILIKFILYPGVGFVLDTESPVVAVVSGSMEHNGKDYDSWWNSKNSQYEDFNITKDMFAEFPFSNGFNTGDLMILKGKNSSELEPGDVIVFKGGEQHPIIHRIVTKTKSEEQYFFSTKGDNTQSQHPYEKSITEERIVGNAVFRIPFLGYVKIAATKLLNSIPFSN